MDPNVSSDRIAVLIDADNTSHSYAEALLDEIAKFGNPTIKRAYGDWSSDRLKGWGNELNLRAIRGMHQGAFTRGKNSTDSAMIIDAMDLLYASNVEAFALVTSDSDFTSLALRLRESGKVVYGLGEKKTPASLQNACDRFIRLESLSDPASVTGSDDAETSTEEPDQVPEVNLQSALTKAVNAVGGDDGWAAPGAIGKHLSRTHPSLDPRNYGHRGLQGLLAAQPYLENMIEGGALLVRVKGKTKASAKAPAKAPAKAAEKTAEKSAEKSAEKAPTQTAEKTAEKAPAKKQATRKRAAKKAAPATPPAEPAAAPAPEEPQVPRVTTTTRTSRAAAKAAATRTAKKAVAPD
ncbi:hypothetical protein GCM10009641_44100 [Mycobacterium cookii]|uniref:HTH OST-type domain-containing protein n=1 Tax=Nocardioides furvisabuli TaxID=375542 RepID=A0ABP5JIQ9_9ACTN|nr:NYN domain-containing protein [Nocardioides furvisabuli]